MNKLGSRIPANPLSSLCPSSLPGIIENSKPTDKVYIDGPCDSKTLAGVLLARFERVSHVTLLQIGPIGRVCMQYGWALEFPNSNICSTIGPGNFLITKNVRLTIYISISL